jgi:hypothetical protein
MGKIPHRHFFCYIHIHINRTMKTKAWIKKNLFSSLFIRNNKRILHGIFFWMIERFNWSTIFSFMFNIFQFDLLSVFFWSLCCLVLLFIVSDYPVFIFIHFFQFQGEISRILGEGSHIECKNKILKLSHMSRRFIFDGSIYKTCGYLDIQIDQIHG